ncbi:hypothetical protein [Streptomyces gobiensis]|uniref:hypothetical protein n=1 Tax=Streptomyces gobiensis TaxID=2875706 RepID=UPI001E5947A3|nr:hypothetical protein [Streptomyces gobiensis]UGY90270.1 hypothetical protein test1122_00020 [Streptomyces gobiensis]UGY94941.1 hypothetical protein test1122_26520 [Streptomyces gobiensis]
MLVRLPGGGRFWGLFRRGVGFRCFAGLKGDGVHGQRAGLEGGGEAGDRVPVGKVAAQQEDLDRSAGAFPLAAGLDGRFPPGVVNGGEPACGPCLVESGGPGQGTRLADECFQVVVQFEAGSAAGR